MAAPPPRRPQRGRKPVQVEQSRSSRVIPGPGSGGTSIRRGAVRLPGDVAYRVEIGHPWVYREALGNRPLQAETGSQVELLGPSGELVGVGLYDPDGAIAVRVFVRSEGRGIDGALVAERVKRAVALRRALLPEGLDAYRVVNAESDGLPAMTVDRYGAYLVVHLFSPSVLKLQDALLDALVAELQPAGVYVQKRFKSLAGDAPRGPGELVRGEAAPVEVVVQENGLKFAVDPTAPLATGLFPDLREGRALVGARSAGKRVLNLFSYTGAFSVYAARAGATEVVSVDLAAKALARGRHNLTLNGLDPEKVEHQAADAFKVLAKFAERGRKFDLVVLDPPSFASGQGRVFSAAKDYAELVTAVLGVTAPGALLACASNTAKLSAEEFDRALAQGAAAARVQVRVVERRGLPADFPVVPGFPEGNYLKFVVLARA